MCICSLFGHEAFEVVLDDEKIRQKAADGADWMEVKIHSRPKGSSANSRLLSAVEESAPEHSTLFRSLVEGHASPIPRIARSGFSGRLAVVPIRAILRYLR